MPPRRGEDPRQLFLRQVDVPLLNIAAPPAVPSPDVGKKLRRRYGLMGPEPVTEISPALSPVVIVDDLTGPALHDVGYIRTCIGSLRTSAVVAENAHVQLFNPVGSGVDLLVEGAIASAGAANTVMLRLHDTALTVQGSEFFRDRRLTGNPAGEIRGVSQGGLLGSQVALIRVAAAESIIIPADVILEPGTGVLVALEGTNDTLEGNFYWSERSQPRT